VSLWANCGCARASGAPGIRGWGATASCAAVTLPRKHARPRKSRLGGETISPSTEPVSRMSDLPLAVTLPVTRRGDHRLRDT